MTKPLFDMARDKGALKRVGQLNFLRRFASPEEVATAVLFLGGDDSSYVTGQALPVCGGLSSSHPIKFGSPDAMTLGDKE
jgi:NAD(P)-dependent dehydrogenase (short-subunit alcohol dehydrogenase family)